MQPVTKGSRNGQNSLSFSLLSFPGSGHSLAAQQSTKYTRSTAVLTLTSTTLQSYRWDQRGRRDAKSLQSYL